MFLAENPKPKETFDVFFPFEVTFEWGQWRHKLKSKCGSNIPSFILKDGSKEEVKFHIKNKHLTENESRDERIWELTAAHLRANIDIQ